MISGVFDWFNYRKEEVELLDKAVESGFRKPPSWRNFLRWHVTYIIILVVVVFILVTSFMTKNILPYL